MSITVAWLCLLLSGLIDVAWAISMKKAEGFAHPGWSLLSVALLAAFVYLLTKALAVLPLGSAYAVWTGIGAIGSVAAGIWLFDEPLSASRITFVALILVGFVGLKQVSA